MMLSDIALKMISADYGLPNGIHEKLKRFLKPIDKERSRFEIMCEETFHTRVVKATIIETIGDVKYIYTIPLEYGDFL